MAFSEHDRLICIDIETVPDRDLIPDWDQSLRDFVTSIATVALATSMARP